MFFLAVVLSTAAPVFAGKTPANFRKEGSAQELVETRILGCFLKNDEFGLGDRHALRLEQQVGEIFAAAAPSKKGFDVAVDGFHHSEVYLRPTVVQDSV
jgi:hypothetical protein